MNVRAISADLMGALASSACTTLSLKDATPEEVDRQLLSGELTRPGDRVWLQSTDEVVHEFRVMEIDVEQGFVIGRDERVPIADVVAVETREISMGKTALSVGDVGCPVAGDYSGLASLADVDTGDPNNSGKAAILVSMSNDQRAILLALER